MKLQKRTDPWKIYEKRKKDLQKQDLPSHQFLEEINKILKELEL